MKKSISVMSLLSGTALLVPGFTFASGNSTQTHTDTPGLKPASSFIDKEKTFQIAAVCFLGIGDCDRNQKYNKGDDYTRDPEDMCREAGYTKTSCTIPEYLYNPCPYDSLFYKECRRDTDKACRDEGYTTSCGTGYVPDTSQVCPYNSSYKKCKCDPCIGYDYSYAQATASGYRAGTSCNSCGSIKYKRQPSACSGYLNCECGGEIGASSCKSGTVTLFRSCKSCCTPSNCTGYDLYTCPTGSNCEVCDRGCGAGNKYRFSNCQSGYYLSGESCTKCGTKTSCPIGESLVNICKINGVSQGDCANCRDENSSFNPCKGYFICDSSKVGDGKTCDCGGITYYERCLVPETCNDDSGNYNGSYHVAVSEKSSMLSSGYYKVAEKCTRQNGTKIFWIKSCISSSLDGSGNYGPCKGKIDCGNDFAVGEVCTCGGKTFGTACATTCNYEETPESCNSKGKSFTFKCGSSDGLQFGVCE